MLPDLVAHLTNGGLLLISGAVRSSIDSYAQRQDQNEAGGVLLGRYRGSHIEIVAATYPGKHDIATKYSFSRAAGHHQKIADQWWEKSGGEITYLGEWHTHPEPIPSPSPLDRNEWLSQLPPRAMILIIQGTESAEIFYAHGSVQKPAIEKVGNITEP